MIHSLVRALASVSVRTRIIGIALIPVVGFLANGISFTLGQSDVTSAFHDVAVRLGPFRCQPRVQDRGGLDAIRSH